jgi:hypothetical protein
MWEVSARQIGAELQAFLSNIENNLGVRKSTLPEIRRFGCALVDQTTPK